MTNGLHAFTFDANICVLAHSLQEAKDKLTQMLNCGIVMLNQPVLLKFDEEPARDVNGKIEIGD